MNIVSSHVFEVLSLLTPYDINRDKLVIGGDGDGSYVMADLQMFDKGRAFDLISFRISTDVRFEKEMAARGHRCFMFDHTIDRLPEQHSNFYWKRTGICPDGKCSDDCLSLTEHLQHISELTDRLILKIDVEGAEWEVFADVRDDTLSHFDQILLEIHWLHKLVDPGYANVVHKALDKLMKTFTIFHVHGNNCAELQIINGFIVADVLEISLVKTSLVERSRSRTVYPTALNKPNAPNAHELPLFFFPFLPLSIDVERVIEVAKRIDFQFRAR